MWKTECWEQSAFRNNELYTDLRRNNECRSQLNETRCARNSRIIITVFMCCHDDAIGTRAKPCGVVEWSGVKERSRFKEQCRPQAASRERSLRLRAAARWPSASQCRSRESLWRTPTTPSVCWATTTRRLRRASSSPTTSPTLCLCQCSSHCCCYCHWSDSDSGSECSGCCSGDGRRRAGRVRTRGRGTRARRARRTRGRCAGAISRWASQPLPSSASPARTRPAAARGTSARTRTPPAHVQKSLSKTFTIENRQRQIDKFIK